MKFRVHNIFFAVFLSVYLFFISCSMAETEKNIKQTHEEFNAVAQELGTHEKSLEVLSQKKKELNLKLDETKKKLVNITRQVNDQENNLNDLNSRINNLETKKKDLENKFLQDKVSISRLILALERIRRTPPEAMIARPSSPYETAQSAMLMGDILPAINRHAKALQNNMDTINAVANDLKQEKEKAETVSKSLQNQLVDLEELIDQRKDLYKKTDTELKAREIYVQKISLQAKTLKDLMKKLQNEEERIDREKKEAEKKAMTLALKKEEEEKKEKYSSGTQLPVNGKIVIGYNQKDDLGAQSNGLTIQAFSGSIVTAPMGGKIQFTGSFKRYGNLIIIEHENGYHSLVAGLEKIDTVVGQIVEVGEPIGKMPQKAMHSHSKLYYELRKNGNPVNPSTKFTNLG